MKGLFIGIIVLLAVILTFSMFIYHLTSEISESLFSNLEELMKKVEEEQWSETALCLERVEQEVEQGRCLVDTFNGPQRT